MAENVVICIEGVDSIGKTSIAKHLSESLGFEYVHCRAPKDEESAKQEYYSILERTENLVLDRSWIGEFVYAPLLRGYTPKFFDELESKIIESDTRTLSLLLYGSEEKMKSLLADRPSPLSDYDKKLSTMHNEVSQSYINVFNKIKSGEKFIFNVSHFPNLIEEKRVIKQFAFKWLSGQTQDIFPSLTNTYYYTLFNPYFRFIDGEMFVPTDCFQACQFFKEHKQTVFWKTNHSITWGAGSLNPDVLFVGEAPGYNGCGRLGIPFYNDKSGMLFREALFQNRILETEIYITNVLKCNPLNNELKNRDVTTCGQHLLAELKKIDPKRIISVGRTAGEFLKINGYCTDEIYHPAYFLYRHMESTYGARMKKVLEESKYGQIRRSFKEM